MEKPSATLRLTVSTLSGAALGYLILHPYTVVVYGLYGPDDGVAGPFDFEYIAHKVLSAFGMHHLQMGIPFLLIGAAGGLFFGLWLNAVREREESELRACATDTLKTLMVTQSHYLLNAVTIIGGFAWRIQKAANDDETAHHAVVIRREAESIEAVVNALRSMQEVASEKYTKDGTATIIDLTEDIRKRMEEQSARSDAGETGEKHGGGA